MSRFLRPRRGCRIVKARCPDCGAEVDVNDGGCTNCGVPFDPEEPLRFGDVERDAAITAGFDDPEVRE